MDRRRTPRPTLQHNRAVIGATREAPRTSSAHRSTSFPTGSLITPHNRVPPHEDGCAPATLPHPSLRTRPPSTCGTRQRRTRPTHPPSTRVRRARRRVQERNHQRCPRSPRRSRSFGATLASRGRQMRPHPCREQQRRRTERCSPPPHPFGGEQPVKLRERGRRCWPTAFPLHFRIGGTRATSMPGQVG